MVYVPEPPERLTAREFLERYVDTGARVELFDGVVIQMASERAGHNRLKAAAHRALSDAIETTGLDCEAFADGMAVVIDETTVFEPDAALRCGPRLGPNEIAYNDPVVVVEVTSPSTGMRDEVDKLLGYAALPSLRHYVILNPMRRMAIHYSRSSQPALATSILSGGPLRLDPPGLTLDLDAIFAALD